MSDQMQTFPVRDTVEHHPGYRSLQFARPFEAIPGQFVMVWLPGVDEKPLSISQLDGDTLEVTVRAVGPFTRALMAVKPGQRLGLRGPFGRGFSLPEHALVVGGGCGIAPLRFLLSDRRRRGLATKTLLGVRTAIDLLYPQELILDETCRIASEDGSIGQRGLVTDLLREALDDSGRAEYVIASGPEPMLVAVCDLVAAAGIPFEINMERYMKCGIGICGQCCLDDSGIRLCLEGPVVTNTMLQDVSELGLPHRDATGARRVDPASC